MTEALAILKAFALLVVFSWASIAAVLAIACAMLSPLLLAAYLLTKT